MLKGKSNSNSWHALSFNGCFLFSVMHLCCLVSSAGRLPVTSLAGILHKRYKKTLLPKFYFFWERNALFIIFLQQILNNKLLLAVTGRQKSNFNSRFKLELIITCYL